MKKKIAEMKNRVLAGGDISAAEARVLMSVRDEEYESLVEAAHEVAGHFHGSKADLCAIVNGKSGRCSENCAYCAQSAHYKSEAEEYSLLSRSEILAKAEEAKSMGARRFSIVTSGDALQDKDFDAIIDAYRVMHEESGLLLCASLGTLTDERAQRLLSVGVRRYHHNLETSKEFFSTICTTHTFQDRVDTIVCAQRNGMEVCSGGIIGMGETVDDRISMALSLRHLGVTSVPINILNPRPGTPLAQAQPLPVEEIITTIAVYKFLLPDQVIRLAGGRETNLRDAQSRAIYAGISGIMIGGYLTTSGNPVQKDHAIIRAGGLEIDF